MEGRPLRVTVGIPGWNVEVVQNAAFVNQFLPCLQWFREFLQQAGDDVPLSLLAGRQVQRLDCLFRSLLSGKTGPLVPVRLTGIFGLFQVTAGLGQPVFCAIGSGQWIRPFQMMNLNYCFGFS